MPESPATIDLDMEMRLETSNVVKLEGFTTSPTT